jgi:hypothetical protein
MTTTRRAAATDPNLLDRLADAPAYRNPTGHALRADPLPDGRSWTVDKTVMAANPGTPLNQPAWSINGSTARIYYRAIVGNNSIVGGALIRF